MERKPKFGSDGLRRLREVWHGTLVSDAAVAPPKPSHLADVTSLTNLQLRGGELLRVSKRDARCCFDQLKLCPELTIGGLSAGEIDEMCANLGATSLDAVFPIFVTWAMGFSWSSFVSQTTMLGICSEAGLTEDFILSADRPTPSQTKCVFAVATDDVILMSTAGPGSTVYLAQAVEENMEAGGMKCHTDKKR